MQDTILYLFMETTLVSNLAALLIVIISYLIWVQSCHEKRHEREQSIREILVGEGKFP